LAFVVITYPKISRKHYNWIQSIRIQYDPQYSIINPHFTLVFPRLVENQEKVIQHLEESVKGNKKIYFLIKRVKAVKDSLSENTYLFLFPDKGSEEITKLHHNLNSGLLSSEVHQDIPFIPHITIGRDSNPNRLNHLEKNLGKRDIYIEGTLESLDVAVFDIGQPVNTIRKIKLED
jgi:2'-5' RNA ligase